MTDSHSQHMPLLDAIRKGKFAPYVAELREHASQGDNASLIALGDIYFRGGDGIPRDYGSALHWFKKVDSEYDVNGFAAVHLAIIYYKGLSVAKDRRIAAKYFRIAALHGHHKSRLLLAILQKKGDGTLKKPRAAETILKASVCDSKLSISMRLLAVIWLYP